jgi:hypothetical protein
LDRPDTAFRTAIAEKVRVPETPFDPVMPFSETTDGNGFAGFTKLAVLANFIKLKQSAVPGAMGNMANLENIGTFPFRL